MSGRWVLGALATLLPAAVPAQPAAPDSKATSKGLEWSVGASITGYIVPDQIDYAQPTVSANGGQLHLEARYNYEALKTGSIFVGWNLEFGETVKLGLTPMLGSVVGDLNGVAIALELSLSWGPLEFSSQGEYVIDCVGSSGSFLYAWSELDVRPWDWIRLGMVVQRTRVFHTPREVVLGPLIGFAAWKLDATFYWFQPGGSGQFFVVSAGVSF
jgi:hypothetical protein